MTQPERIKGFMQDRFGMFIHFGLYAVPARGEWVQSLERIGAEEYHKYFERFNPTEFNPREWAKLAKECGMKYAVMTAKHHDGFCLFDSALTDYKSTNTPFGRDLVREYTEAFRAEGLKVGLYYSLLDWHHPDFPAYHDQQHPMRDNEAFRDIPQNFSNYIEYFHGQVRELLTNYGKIDILWFDFSYKDSVNDMSGEKWGAADLIRMIRGIQPEVVLDDRLGRQTGPFPKLLYGDYSSPEQYLPKRCITDAEGNELPWEACVTLNDHWGYYAGDDDYKTPKNIVRSLVECTSKNGNLIVNVGPNAKGLIPEKSQEVLREVGKWMKANGSSIYGCGRSDLEKPEWGRYTENGKKLYAHILDRGIGHIHLEGLAGKVRCAHLLADGSEVNTDLPWNEPHNAEDAFLNLRSASLPDDADTVVEIDLK